MAYLLPTKFYLPPIPSRFVVRPQLMEILEGALLHRLTLVSAPAGAGKTTLVGAWVQSARKREVAFGWLSLDAADNNLRRFLEYLAACLEEGGTVFDNGFPAFVQEERDQVNKVAEDLIRGVINLDRDFILILDDYHHIQNKDIHSVLEYFLEHAPARLHLVLLTRSDPPLELARRRIAGQLLELRMEHLRFTTQEAAMFLKESAGVHLTDADVAILNGRTEGWIAGLQMAAISLRGRSDVQAFIAAFAGSHRFVFDYLLEQVLSHQTSEIREFLLRTSILDRLSAPLCDAVTGLNQAAHDLIGTLERANLFLVPLDDERNWYRYHHLFADLLKLMLEQTRPGLSAELHRRACTWYEAHGMYPDALHHALSADDKQLVARLVSTNVLAFVEYAELEPIVSRIDAESREYHEPNPWLGVAHAWALTYTGKMERASVVLAVVERYLDKLSRVEQEQVTGHIAAVRAYVAWVQGDQQSAVEFAEDAARHLPSEEFAVRALNLTTLGNALSQYHTNPQAVDVLKQAVLMAQQAKQSHVLMLAATALAYACIGYGRLHQAHQICMEAVEAAETYQRTQGHMLNAVAIAYALLARIWGEWGEIEKAIGFARKGLSFAESWGQVDTVMMCLFYLALPLNIHGETVEANQLIQRARRIAERVSPWFVLNVDQVELDIFLDKDEQDINEIRRVVQRWKRPGMQLAKIEEARLLLKQNRLDETLALVERYLLEDVEPLSLDTLRMGIIQSLAYFKKKDEARALKVLKQLLDLAEPENMVASFTREGASMEKLLRLALVKSIHPEFVHRLLTALEAKHKLITVTAAETLIEPLSERELEILQILNGPLSIPEIARQLFVSPNTVRTHIKNIYGKLGVHGRSSAVRKAKELRLL